MDADSPGQARATVADLVTGLALVRPIGHGRQATVFHAHDTTLDRPVALKIVDRARDRDSYRRVVEGCQTTGPIGWHPNVVDVHAAGFTPDGRAYLVMPLLPGGSLADALRRGEPIAWTDIVALGVKLAGALEACHRSGRVHGGVRPSNVLFDHLGEPALVDAGIEPRTTDFAAPESTGGLALTAASDQYALALTMSAALASPANSSGVPDDLAAVLRTAVARDASSRHPSMAAFAAALQRVEADHAVPVTPIVSQPGARLPTPVPRAIARAQRAPRTHRVARLPMVLACLGGALAVAVLAGLFILDDGGEGAAVDSTAVTTTSFATTVTTDAPITTVAPSSTEAPTTASTVATTEAPTTTLSTTTTLAPAPIAPPTGYQVAFSDGRVLGFGSATSDPSLAEVALSAPVVGGARTGTGSVLLSTDGSVFALGTAFHGGWNDGTAGGRVAAVLGAPGLDGYWLVSATGAVRAFGAAPVIDGLPAAADRPPIVAAALAPGGTGIWLAATDGSVYPLGTATPADGWLDGTLPSRVAAIVATPAGDGYWLVTTSGAIRAFGAAPTIDGLPVPPATPITAAVAGGPRGILATGQDGGVFAFGDAPFHGAPAAQGAAPGAVALVPTP
jgi:hypothetical protein